MPRRIISATDYGFRKVIRVVMDDAIPEWIHPGDGGGTHTAATARGPRDVDDNPGVLDPTLRAGTECHACVFNQDVREFTFSREEFEIEDPPGSGLLRNRSDLELVTEIQLGLTPAPPATPIGPLQNAII